MLERRSSGPQSTTLVDILDKVLDKGLVVAGDIRVSVANVELLTVQIRLLICSVDKAQEIGMDWWRRDNFLGDGAGKDNELVEALQARIDALEQRLALAGEASGEVSSPVPQPRRRRTREARRETRDES